MELSKPQRELISRCTASIIALLLAWPCVYFVRGAIAIADETA